MEIIQIITIIIAMIGAVLGILNTWDSFDRKKVKVKIVPSKVKPVYRETYSHDFQITVRNLSNFQITICEVGFLEKKKKALPYPLRFISTSRFDTLPCVLDPRRSINFYLTMSDFIKFGKHYSSAYIKTECGKVKKGTSSDINVLNSVIILSNQPGNQV